ncbi:hypothetical protein [Nostoc sp.]|uniref:hypothetical protein n=1 Tax=Nostoc sp. TaxID=1180 RepID=UPI002FFACD48
MTTETCPRCDSTRLQHREGYGGYWECFECGHNWGFDEDNPEYRWAVGAEHDNRSLCGTCNGGGLIQSDGELYCCQSCGGSGSL